VRTWHLDVALACLEQSIHAGFAALSIVTSYFEMIGKYQTGYLGAGQSKKHFGRGVSSVFPELSDAAKDILYERVRCGLYHVSSVRGSEVLLQHNYYKPVDFNPDFPILVINPKLFVTAIIEHFDEYIAQLTTPSYSTLRANFVARFDDESKQLPSLPAPALLAAAEVPNLPIDMTQVRAWVSGGISEPGEPGTITP
jgi:hypothetical protein